MKQNVLCKVGDVEVGCASSEVRFVGKREDPHVVELFIVPQTGRPELRLVPLPRSCFRCRAAEPMHEYYITDDIFYSVDQV